MKYVRWAEERNSDSNSDIWLIRIEVPEQGYASLRANKLNFSNPWKHYVWHCRLGRHYRKPPPDECKTLVAYKVLTATFSAATPG